MNMLRVRHLFGLLLGLCLTLFAHHARADCDQSPAAIDTGICQAQEYSGADMALNDTYRQLYMRLTPAGQAALEQREQAWQHQRDENCAFLKHGAVLVDFRCALHLTVAQGQLLYGWLYDPSSLPSDMPYNGSPPGFGGIMPNDLPPPGIFQDF